MGYLPYQLVQDSINSTKSIGQNCSYSEPEVPYFGCEVSNPGHAWSDLASKEVSHGNRCRKKVTLRFQDPSTSNIIQNTRTLVRASFLSRSGTSWTLSLINSLLRSVNRSCFFEPKDWNGFSNEECAVQSPGARRKTRPENGENDEQNFSRSRYRLKISRVLVFLENFGKKVVLWSRLLSLLRGKVNMQILL